MSDERTGWPAGSPYHRGEAAVQERAGVRDLAERVGRKIIRDFLPDQHRDFYEALPWVLVGSRDPDGWPWASALVGAPGFVQAPDRHTLEIEARPGRGDPFTPAVGDPVAVLGLQSETRRRNRANGVVAAVSATGLTVAVRQAFGNCPQYIRSRAPTPLDRAPAGAAIPEGAVPSDEALALILRADTLFLATISADAGGPDPVEGADVSHRGGRPGFVRVDREEDGVLLTIPDFAGNSAFNTFGNLALNPRAGLLFVDFRSGTSLQLTGEAWVVWDSPEIAAFQGAERLLRFRPRRGVRIPSAVPLGWSDGEAARQVAATGSWR